MLVNVKIKLIKKKKNTNEQTTDETKTEGDTTTQPKDPKDPKDKEPKEKVVTVIERPETPIGGAMKTTGKNSPSQKPKQKVNAKEITHKVESPVNRNDTTKANTNQNTKNKETKETKENQRNQRNQRYQRYKRYKRYHTKYQSKRQCFSRR